ncbi:mCG145056, partial [Mus musculus]
PPAASSVRKRCEGYPVSHRVAEDDLELLILALLPISGIIGLGHYIPFSAGIIGVHLLAFLFILQGMPILASREAWSRYIHLYSGLALYPWMVGTHSIAQILDINLLLSR